MIRTMIALTALLALATPATAADSILQPPGQIDTGTCLTGKVDVSDLFAPEIKGTRAKAKVYLMPQCDAWHVRLARIEVTRQHPNVKGYQKVVLKVETRVWLPDGQDMRIGIETALTQAGAELDKAVAVHGGGDEGEINKLPEIELHTQAVKVVPGERVWIAYRIETMAR